MNVAILIPAFRPEPGLIDLVKRLAQSAVCAVAIVDDGSGDECRAIFDDCSRVPKVCILRHDVNLGKGAAIKTGLRHVREYLSETSGVVTADADGQHHPEDILRVAHSLEVQPDRLVLGSRKFGRSTPAANRAANIISRGLVRIVVGQKLRDTQTGLRGIPSKLIPFLLELHSSRYEFELDMLTAAKHHGCPIVEVPIRTIYGSDTSHFDPVRDSMKILFVLFRFSTLSLLTALVDNVVFFLAYLQIPSILLAQVAGRIAAVSFNYKLARRAVFLSRQPHRIVLPRYLLLVLCSGTVSYGLIRLFTHVFGMPANLAKVAAESLLFFVNFALQRDFVFTKPREAGATDWTRYYRSVPVTARLTRKYTARVLVGALKRFGSVGDRPDVIVELGGANSCFLDRVVTELRPRTYHVVDLNDYGLALLRERDKGPSEIRLHRQDVRNLQLQLQADTVFSIGLIEHFDPEGTQQVILRHFDLLKADGCAILSFPTPTWLYRAARRLAEFFGLWNFPDERPLSRSEVMQSIPAGWEVRLEKTLWPLVLTQHMMVIRKASQ